VNRQPFLPLHRAAFAGAMLVCAVLPAQAFAQQPDASVVRVEEDWELYVGDPDINSNGPQVACTFSPAGHLNGEYAVFEVNFQSLPDYVRGGLQLQIWEGETPTDSHKFPSSSAMATSEEVVKWTQTMDLHGGVITYEIVNGTSTTWGSFGGQGYLKHSCTTSLDNLNGYSANLSIANSGAAFAGNRVRLLVLRAVRYHLSDGQVVEDTLAHVAHPLD